MRILRAKKYLTHPRRSLARRIAKLCQKYIDWHEGYSYEFEQNGELQLLRQLSKLDLTTVFDVGANVGDWTSLASKHLLAAKFYCFEISQETFEALESNLSDSRFELANFGLSDVSAEISYKDYGKNSGVNTILLNAKFHDLQTPPKVKKAKVMSGEEYCKKHKIEKIDFLKIDVEGAEHLVLQGFEKFFEEQRIRLVQFEYGFVNGDSKFLMKDFHHFFDRYGYVLGRLQNGPITFRDFIYKDNNFRSGPNYIACHQSDRELLKLLS